MSQEQKAELCQGMARLISDSFEGWELKFNEPGYSEDCRSPEQGIRSVSVYKNRKFVGHRLLLPGSSAEKLLFEIAGVFLVAREKIKEAERKS